MKKYLSNSMRADPATISIESDIVANINYTEIVDEFTPLKVVKLL